MTTAKEITAVLTEISTTCETGTNRCQIDDQRFDYSHDLGVLAEYDGIENVTVELWINHTAGEFLARLTYEFEGQPAEFEYGFFYKDATEEEIADAWGF